MFDVKLDDSVQRKKPFMFSLICEQFVGQLSVLHEFLPSPKGGCPLLFCQPHFHRPFFREGLRVGIFL